MDIFSCKPFDTAAARRLVDEHLQVTDCKTHTVERTDPRL